MSPGKLHPLTPTRKRILKFALLSTLCHAHIAQAAPNCIASCSKFESLSNYKKSTINLQEGTINLITFFSESCPTCTHQFKEATCLEKNGFKIAHIGIGHQKARLSSKLGGTVSSLGRYQMSLKQATKWQIVGTPYHWLFTEDRKIPLIGYHNCQSMIKIVHRIKSAKRG